MFFLKIHKYARKFDCFVFTGLVQSVSFPSALECELAFCYLFVYIEVLLFSQDNEAELVMMICIFDKYISTRLLLVYAN